MRKAFLLLAAMALSLAMQAQPIPADPAFRTGKLANGLTYYIAHNGNPAGCADFYIAHNVGALQEEDSQDGLAHFLEHMAFNGSKHYSGNSLLTFLAGEGVRFGYNVNAYTTRNETVYNISSVPLVRESFIDSVLLILHDWSGDISCEPQALDDERGVISEEYRMRDDSRSRIAGLQNALVYKGAKQTRRSVIGSLDVINSFKREEILDFYHKWYRPDLQAIFVVGDFDPEWMEAKVKTMFADIPMPENAPQKESYFPPHLDEPLFEDIADNRLKFQAVKIFYKQPYASRENRPTREFYRDLYCRNIVSAILGERLKDAMRKKDSPMRSAVVVTNEYEPEYLISLFTITPKDKSLLGACLESTYREVRRLLLHGVSPAEFEAGKLAIAQRFHLDRPLDREDVKSGDIVKEAVGHFLKNHPLVHPSDLHDLQADILGSIGYEDILPYPARMFRDSEVIYTNCYNPAEDPGIAPSADEMKAILTRVDAEEIAPNFLEYATPDLHVDAAKGAVRKIRHQKGYEIWTLSNGVRIYYQQARPVSSNIHLAVDYRWETGARTYDPEKMTASRLASAFISQHLGFRGLEKQDFRNYPQLSGLGYQVSAIRNRASIRLSVNKGKEEDAFRTVYLALTEPYFGKQLGRTRENQLKSLAKKKNARTLFEERCDREVYGDHPWLQPVDSAAVQALDMDLVQDVFHRAFGDCGKLSVFITSDLDREAIQEYVCRYIASLPTAYPYEPSKVQAPAPQVKGRMVIAEEHAPEGEPLTQIYHALLRREKATTHNIVVSDFLDYILSARYLALIREERGAAYHVGYSTVLPDNPSHPWRGVVQFQTRPDMQVLVLQDIDAVMKKMSQEGPTEAEMEMAARYLVKQHGQNEARVARSLPMQLERLEDTVLLGRNYDIDYKKVVSNITARDIRKMARNFAAGDVLLEVYTEK